MTEKLLMLVIYMLVLFVIGIIASRRIHSIDDYYVGGHKLGYWVAAFSARATGESAWLLLGLTGLGAAVGLSAFWVVLGEIIGVGTAWFLMARPFHRKARAAKAITIPDYLVARFTDGSPTGLAMARNLRFLAAGCLALFVTIYVSAQIDATGKAFESFLDWNYYVGIAVGFGIVMIYTVFGGFLAVAWSDLLQGSLMLFGLVALPAAAMIAMPAPTELMHSLAALDPGLVNIWGPGGFNPQNLLIVISYVAIGLGFMGSPQIFVRFIAIRDEQAIKNGRWVAIVFTLITDSAAVMIGMIGHSILVSPGTGVEQVLGSGAEQVLPLLAEWTFPALIVGIYTAVVLSAIMSTVDSLLVVASSAVGRDLYQQQFHPGASNAEMTSLSRKLTLAMALLALVIALVVAAVSPDRTIFWFVIFGWSGIAATFCPTIILSLTWPEFNGHGALAAMVSGFLMVPIAKFLLPLIPGVGSGFAVIGELLPAFAVAMFVGIWRSKSNGRNLQPAE
jgi:sodium/proline symporter